MRKAIGASLALVALTAGWLIYHRTASTNAALVDPAQASTGTMWPFELMTSRGKDLPAENWPAF